MIKKEQFLNYTLSMGLIILILLFLISILQISRYVLEDTSTVREHMASTRILLNDIQEVENNFEAKDSQTGDAVYFNSLRNTRHLETSLKRVDNYNMPNGDGIITMVFDSKIQQFNNTYYLEIDNISNLQIGENILFRKSSMKDGVIFDIEDGNIKVINFDTREKFDLSITDVIGKVIVRTKNE